MCLVICCAIAHASLVVPCAPLSLSCCHIGTRPLCACVCVCVVCECTYVCVCLVRALRFLHYLSLSLSLNPLSSAAKLVLCVVAACGVAVYG
jgi:hypothetical protein